MTARPASWVALAALFALPVPASAADDLARCTLHVAAAPPELPLGEGARATLRIEGGSPAAPRLTTTAGRIEAPREVAPGVFTAELVPPDEAVPQLAIVTAADGAACGWTAVRLVGQGEAIVRSTPGARIVVRIAERSYGPARADGAGVARLPVFVPPGVRVAYHGSRAIPLAVPPVQRLQLVLDRAAARADLAADVAVRVFATTEEGAPWTGARVELSATSGEVPRLVEVAPGELVGRWRLSAGVARDERLVARVAGEAPEAVGRLSRPPGAVARVSISAGAPASADVEEVQVDVRMADAAGNPVDAPVEAHADAGHASPATRVAPGAARFSVRLPQDAALRDRVAVSAAAGNVTARSTIPLVAGPPARIATEATDLVLSADGRSTGRFPFAVVDRRAVPVPSASAGATATDGVVATVEGDRPGRFVVTYRSPQRADDATATLDVRAEGLASVARLRLLGARATLELVPSVGLALTPRRASLEPSLQAVAWTRRLGPDLGLALQAGWTATSERSPATAGSPDLDARATYLWLLAGPAWRRSTSSRTMLWVTAAAGAARASSSVRVGGVPSVAEVAWVPAAGAAIAWGVRAWRGFPYVEAGARWQGDPHLAGLSGSLHPITLSVGYRLEAF